MERDELAELFEQYGTDVFRLAFSYLGSRADAEDICQSVFLKLAEGRQGPRPDKEKSWLLTCTANACKSHLRSFWYRSVGELDEAALFRDEEDRAVYQAVLALPRPYRTAIHLHYCEGYSVAEIASLTGAREGTVKSWLARGRGRLAAELKGDD